jgi:glycosyltransferase involved in cell wall biosynthesis
MKVLLIAHSCISPFWGVPRAKALTDFPDIKLCVLTPSRWFEYGRWHKPRGVEESGFSYLSQHILFPKSGPAKWYLHIYPKLASLLSSFRPDIVDLWEEPWSMVAFQVACLLSLLRKQTKLLVETEQNIHRNLPPPFESIRKFVFHHSCGVVCRSRGAADVARRCGYQGHMEIIPNGVDVQLFHPDSQPSRKRCKSPDTFAIAYSGRLIQEKGVDDLIDSLKNLPVSVKCNIAGEGPSENELRKHSVYEGLSDRVRFLGCMERESLPGFYLDNDVLVLPSHSTATWKEQFGRVLAEAQACGIPVVGSDSGAIPEVIGEAGLVYPEGNRRKLSEALQLLIDNEELRIRLGKVGRHQAETLYSWETVGRRYHSMYQALS